MSRRFLPQNPWIWVLLAAAFAGTAHAQLPAPRGKVITWQSPTGATESCVGILGEIARPGVYRLEPNAMSVQALVKRAGGLTDEATQTIRIVRQERVAQNLFFSPQLECSLLPHDLLVVESKSSQAAAASELINADPRLRAVQQAAAATTDAGVVQVAFLNVLERPVVVKVKHENARVDHLVQMLDQPIELARGVRVLGGDRFSGSQTSPTQILSTLTNGSVLVFPKNTINQGRLPPLPIPYESEIAVGAFPSLIGGPTGQSPELRNVGSLAPMIARNSSPGILPHSGYEHATNPIPVSPPTAIPAIPAISAESNAVRSGPSMPMVSSPPRIARNLPFSGDARITSSSSRTISDGDSSGTNATPSRPKGSPSNSGAAKSPSNPALDAEKLAEIDDLAEFNDPKPIQGSSTFSFGQMLGILACVGGLIGIALLVRRHLDHSIAATSEIASEPQTESFEMPSSALERNDVTQPEAAHSPLPVELPTAAQQQPIAVLQPITAVASVTAAPQFERLIRNELPVREEPVTFPSGIVLQGRIAPRPIFRVDAAASHALGHGPHFSIESTETPLEETSSTSIVTDQLDRPHSSKPAKPHFLRKRAAEKTAAATASISEPHDSLSQTPVSDALRQLQGGQL